jgi:hypothetical protein
MQSEASSLTPDARYGVWRVLIDLEFPVLLLRACRSLLSSDEQHTMPALVACDAEAAAAVEVTTEAGFVSSGGEMFSFTKNASWFESNTSGRSSCN